jgi:endoglucanase
MPHRRAFLRTTAAAMGVAPGLGSRGAFPAELADAFEEPTPARLPRWRGFNLLSLFNAGHQEPFPESDFGMIRELGFDFARLPMDYRCWTEGADRARLREEGLKRVDDAVAHGRKHGVHVQLNMHRIPGFTVASPAETPSLWSDGAILEIAAAHWAAFARRYQGIPNRELSFNLINEPTEQVTPEQHHEVVARLARAIREVDRDRLIVCDGRAWARIPPEELLDLRVAASLHGYEPMHVSHYKASWIHGSDRWPEPTWPLAADRDPAHDRASLRARQIEPWRGLQARGMGVHVGECGGFNRTPHSVFLGWMTDCLSLWKGEDWGWALWNFRGPFGVLDSHREDVRYESWKGHKLDRALLELLQNH